MRNVYAKRSYHLITTDSLMEDEVKHKTAYGLWILKNNSLKHLLWEIVVYILKPIKTLYEYVRWQWILQHTGTSLIEKKILGHYMFLAKTDEGISRELALYGIHEPVATQLLCHTLKPGMNVVDIGSNLGYYTLLECRHIGDNGKVVVIEPHPENFCILWKNVTRNQYQQKVIFYQAAVTTHSCTGRLYTSKKYNLHSLTSSMLNTENYIEVSTYTLDEIVEQIALPIHLIRMDIEGHEVEAIQGMHKTIKRDKPLLFIELHPFIVGGDAIVGVLKQLQDFGYEVEWVVDRLRDQPWHSPMLLWESRTLTELIEDRRILQELSCLTVLFTIPKPS